MHATAVEEDHSLVWRAAPDPQPGPGEAMVRIHATAVNRADLLQRIGLYSPPPGASHILGLECAGIVEAVADDADSAWVGRRVAALLSGGGYAEKVAVPTAHLLQMPDSMSFTDAAAIPEVFITAFLNLRIEGQLEPGEHVLIHAAASGVGTAALQICRELGCPAIATASGAKLSQLTALGATTLVDRNAESFDEVVTRVTSGRGVDVILDPVGADYFERNMQSLALKGRLVTIGLLGGTSAEINLNTLLRRRLRVVGSVLRSRTHDEKAAIIQRFAAEIWPMFEAGRIAPVIDRVLEIQQAGEAQQLLRDNETIGKVVLRT